MSFYGSSFSFDGVSCEEYGLMLYDFGSTTHGNSEYAKVDIQEDRIPGRTRSLFYGTSYEDPLEFKLVFGAMEDVANNDEPIDRSEMEVIAGWLTGHNEYKWLMIDEFGLESIRYRCIITDLKTIEVDMYKWAFECTVHCDSPYGYTLPEQFTYQVDGTSSVVLHSRSSMNAAYLPVVSIRLNDNGNFSITNSSDGGKEFTLTGYPQTSDTITVNSETGVVSSASGLNVYPYLNFAFPRLVRGKNELTITGNGTVTFTCEFPVNVGG